MKMWSGRFRQPLDPEFESWQRSFPYDQRLLPFELAASQAHARALHDAGILDPSELSTILVGLQKIGEEASVTGISDSEAEDVHHYVEKRLAALIGPAAYKLHTGRSRNEQVATDLRLYVRSSIDALRENIGLLLREIVECTESAELSAMPAYTHAQPAEPVLIAHWLLAYLEMFLRDADRLAGCRKRTNLCPLGSGAVAGATLALNRVQIANELGFDGITANSVDATSDRDFAIEFVSVLTLIAIHLSRFAEEMILFATPAYGFIDLPEAFSTGSSAMPQKKNPDLMELVRAKAARVLGESVALQACVKGLPLAYNKDLQETQQPLFNATETVLAIVPMVTAFLLQVEFNTARMQQAAETGFMNAWTAATYLVNRGIASRQAHEIIGKAVQLCVQRGCELANLPLADLKAIHSAFEESFYSSLSLQNALAIHDVPGGTAPARVQQALREARERIAQAIPASPKAV
jgi:argininosuccinate lyase